MSLLLTRGDIFTTLSSYSNPGSIDKTMSNSNSSISAIFSDDKIETIFTSSILSSILPATMLAAATPLVPIKIAFTFF